MLSATILENKSEEESRMQDPFFPPVNYFPLLGLLYLKISTFKIFDFQLSTVRLNPNYAGMLKL